MAMDYRKSPEVGEAPEKGRKDQHKTGGQWRPSMPASLCDSIKKDNISKSQTYTIEEYTEDELKILGKDKAFKNILNGGKLKGPLKIKLQVAERNGHLIYNGRPYNRSCWSWRPPKIIRLQGRSAKELSDPINNRPEISIYTNDGKIIRLDRCPCGGELLMDHNYNLYCKNCSIIYE